MRVLMGVGLKHDSNNNVVKNLIKLKYCRIERYRTIKS